MNPHVARVVTPPQVLSWEEKAIIFCNLDDIYELHCRFSAALERTVQDDPTQIALLFVASEFKNTYAQYCSNHPRAVRILQERLVHSFVSSVLLML